MKRIFTLLSCSLVLAATSSWALTLGSNITIYDGAGTTPPPGEDGEDGETEPGMVNNPAWDLEAFLLDGTSLSLVGGYDFKDGYGGMAPGDIFIDINGSYGSSAELGYTPAEGNIDVQLTFGYEYALALTFADSGNTYEVYALDNSSWVTTAFYPQNEAGDPGSNPWRYASGGKFVEKGSFSFTDSPADGSAFVGDTHYAISGFDLSFLTTVGGLSHGDTFTTHFTMECGNDNLMGQSSVVPEPATLLLLGTGLTGLSGIARRRTSRED